MFNFEFIANNTLFKICSYLNFNERYLYGLTNKKMFNVGFLGYKHEDIISMLYNKYIMYKINVRKIS